MFLLKIESILQIDEKFFPDSYGQYFQKKEDALKEIKELLKKGVRLNRILLSKNKKYLSIPNQTLKEADWEKFLYENKELNYISNEVANKAKKYKTFEEFSKRHSENNSSLYELYIHWENIQPQEENILKNRRNGMIIIDNLNELSNLEIKDILTEIETKKKEIEPFVCLGTMIDKPLRDFTERFEVDPIEEYGKINILHFIENNIEGTNYRLKTEKERKQELIFEKMERLLSHQNHEIEIASYYTKEEKLRKVEIICMNCQEVLYDINIDEI